jgi:uncharacterized protein YeaO (DUF488 family)
MIQCKSAYADPTQEDGSRVLVDRLWPRDCPEDSLQLAAWLPDVGPSTELHKAFHSKEISFAQFSVAYRRELAANPQSWWQLLLLAERGTLTLIFAATDPQANSAMVLVHWLEDELDRHEDPSSPVCYLSDFPDY